MQGLTEGRIVHYVLPYGEHRPAIIVKVWNDTGTVNLQVFLDGDNDAGRLQNYGVTLQGGLWWRTSTTFDEVNKIVGTWHWIERKD